LADAIPDIIPPVINIIYIIICFLKKSIIYNTANTSEYAFPGNPDLPSISRVHRIKPQYVVYVKQKMHFLKVLDSNDDLL
jgi:hypothetical protein